MPIRYGGSKYHAKITEVDGIKFASMAEARYYTELKMRMSAGDILGFCRQPRFPLGAGVEYVGDFMVVGKDGTEVIEIKGRETQTYIVKRKFFRDKYPNLIYTVIKVGG